MKRTVLAFLLSMVCVACFAGDKQPIPAEHIYGPMMGKRVTLDALTWDHAKGLSGRVLLPSGDSVYVSEFRIRRADGTLETRLPRGKLVRLVGVLTFARIPPLAPAPRGEFPPQGYPRGISYFALALESFSVIEKAEREFPALSPK